MKKKGFKFNGKIIKYIDAQGKDTGKIRWRLSLYYHPTYAITHFCETEDEYNAFLEKYSPYCYDNYLDYVELYPISY